MDLLSATSSLIAVLQLSVKVLAYLDNVKDASKERTQCAVEMLNLCNLLYKLRDHAEKGDANQPWYAAFGTLAAPDGPLDQFKQTLKALETKMTKGNRLKKAGEALLWKCRRRKLLAF